MKQLTQEQLAVVHHPLDQHARVLAVAGSGKSTTMAYRILHLINHHGVRPGAIQVLMFNALARKQFTAHLEKIGLTEIQQPVVHTFHSFCFHIINEMVKRGYLPPQLHLDIAPQQDPPLFLSLLRARDQITELRAVDLRFTSTEAADFLNQVMGLNLSSRDIAELESRTEGWIAGLQLAAVSLQGRKDRTGLIRSFTGGHRLVLDFLIEEVHVWPSLHLYLLAQWTHFCCFSLMRLQISQPLWLAFTGGNCYNFYRPR